jgi:hypothetical protein
MDSKKIVYQETGIVAIGVLICTAVMIGAFALLGKFDTSVLLGGIVGAILSIGNFFFMAVGTSLAADRAEKQDVKGGQVLIRNSYMLRLAVLFVLLFACAKSGLFNLFALVLPLIFVRPSLTIAEFFRKKGNA